jgi:adenine-specific DNA-methyltransferase
MSDKLDLTSPDLVNENFEKLATLFPNCVTESAEGKAIDFDLLKQELNHAVVEGTKERYRLEWPGKKEAIVTANIPTTKTLRPVREDSVDFDNTENIYIEGDNLEVLKLLQESYLGKIKMIYIDPPYNTGKDFVYKDKFSKDTQEELFESGQKDEYNQRLVVNPETAGRYHSDWLSMMYPRLKLARKLLTEDGVIFISIDDNEIHNLRKLCDEIFGEHNFLGLFIVNSSPSGIDYGHLAKTNDYALFYGKDFNKTTTNQIEEEDKEFKFADEKGGYNLYPLYNGNAAFNDKTRPNLVYPFYLNTNNNYKEDFYEISVDKKDGWIEIYPVIGQKDGIQRVWRWGKPKSRENLNDEIVGFKNREGEYRIVQKSRLTTKVIRSLQLDNEVSSRRGTLEIEALFGKKVFSYPKPSALIERFATIATDEESIILDFFAGSSSSAHAILKLNAKDSGKRKFIQIQIPEVIEKNSIAVSEGYSNLCEIGKERIRRASKKINEDFNSQLSILISQLEKLLHSQLIMKNDQWVFPEGEIIDEKAENLLLKINKLQLTIDNLDTGFRVYRLDESNMQDVYYRPQDYKQEALDLFADNVKPDRTADDLLAQVMLDWGLPLSLKIEQVKIAGKQVFKVAEDSLFACFDKGIDEEFAKAIALDKPLRIVFRDNAFKNDTAKTNVKQLLKQLSPETEMKVI